MDVAIDMRDSQISFFCFLKDAPISVNMQVVYVIRQFIKKKSFSSIIDKS